MITHPIGVYTDAGLLLGWVWPPQTHYAVLGDGGPPV